MVKFVHREPLPASVRRVIGVRGDVTDVALLCYVCAYIANSLRSSAAGGAAALPPAALAAPYLPLQLLRRSTPR